MMMTREEKLQTLSSHILFSLLKIHFFPFSLVTGLRWKLRRFSKEGGSNTVKGRGAWSRPGQARPGRGSRSPRRLPRVIVLQDQPVLDPHQPPLTGAITPRRPTCHDPASSQPRHRHSHPHHNNPFPSVNIGSRLTINMIAILML